MIAPHHPPRSLPSAAAALLGLWALAALTPLGACSDDGGNGDTGCVGSECGDDRGRDAADLGADVPPDEPDAVAETGDDVADAQICEPLTERICFDQTSYRVCNSAGTAFNAPVNCGQFQTCANGFCLNPEACRPGPLGCADEDTVLYCHSNGFLREERDCDEGLVCYEARCVAPACAPDTKSYIGCEFWATDLDNEPSAASRPVVVTVANFNDEPVHVTLINQTTYERFEETVAARRLQTFTLHDIQINDTELSRKTFRIQTTLPVTVHQFNPQNNRFQVFSNDASLLLPAGSLGRDYVVLGWPARNDVDEGGWVLSSFVTLVGVIDNTAVTIRAREGVSPGVGFPGLAPGEQTTITLNAGDVLNMITLPEHGADLSGMELQATQEIAVFAGSECANVPLGVAYCDHIEQQLMPVDTWGSEFVAFKFAPRGVEEDIWRILSARDDNVITTLPALPGVDGVRLDRGEVLEFRHDGHFRIFGTAPLLVGQFMVGSRYSVTGGECMSDDCAIPRSEFCGGYTGIGDPAYLLNVPVNQYRDAYLVLTPANYQEDYLTFVYEDGTELQLDGQELDTSAAHAVGSGAWRVLHVPVRSGQHIATGSAPFGLYAYGYDCDVSYAYPAGLNLERQR
jgi:hypothetical protein